MAIQCKWDTPESTSDFAIHTVTILSILISWITRDLLISEVSNSLLIISYVFARMDVNFDNNDINLKHYRRTKP